jgi:histone-lysine N-methyltransferase SETMAR
MSESELKFERNEMRAIIAFHWKKGLNAQDCHKEITSVLGDSAVSLATVYNWYAELRRGRRSFEDDPRSGRPVEVTTDEFVAAVEGLVRDDPKITCRQISELLNISTERAHHILRNILHLRNVCVKWVPHTLTEAQMKERVKISQENLKMLREGGDRIISQIVTGDETWVYYYDAPSNQEAKIWISQDEEPPKMMKKDIHVKKVMYAVFFRSTGLVKIVKLDEQKTITGAWYSDICLPQVFEAIANERPKSGIRGIILHHDNARPHSASITKEFLDRSKVKLMRHPPYSPDIAPCDFWLFKKLKKHLRGKRFNSGTEIDTAVNDFFASITKEEWRKVFYKWQERMERCIGAQGDYF